MTEPNFLNKFWANGGSAINAWLAINSPVSAEAMAKATWDTVPSTANTVWSTWVRR